MGNWETRFGNWAQFPLGATGKPLINKLEKFEKKRKSVWSDNAYTVERIMTMHGQKYYKLEGLSREYMRHELLKV